VAEGAVVNRGCRFLVYQWLKNSLNALLPPTCRLCGAHGRSGHDLCPGCAEDLPWLSGGCPRCARPLAGVKPLPCGACLRRPPPFERVEAPFSYAAPVDHLIHAFKFRADLAAGRLLAQLLVGHVRRRSELPELLLPVPLHPARLGERGFNQAHELARLVGRKLAIPVAPTLLTRTRHTPPQHGLAAKARRANVRGAFALSRPLPARHVALIDDVFTTGQTATELARVLRRAGAERVEVWVLARVARQA
jgi:ComF family protein